MRPVLFTITLGRQSLEVGAYGAMLTLAAVVSVVFALVMARRKGLPARRVGIFLGAVALAVLVGARLGHAALNPGFYSGRADRLFALEPTGFALYGGLLLAALVGLAAARHLALPLWVVADATVPGLAVGIAVARLGCFFNGCCFGRPTDLPWAVGFPAGSLTQLSQLESGAIGLFQAPLPVHPTQLYEGVTALLIGVIAVWLGRNKTDGVSFLGFVSAFSAFRMIGLAFRVPATTLIAPPWFYPVLYSALIAAGGVMILMAMLRRSPWPKKGTVPPALECGKD